MCAGWMAGSPLLELNADTGRHSTWRIWDSFFSFSFSRTFWVFFFLGEFFVLLIMVWPLELIYLILFFFSFASSRGIGETTSKMLSNSRRNWITFCWFSRHFFSQSRQTTTSALSLSLWLLWSGAGYCIRNANLAELDNREIKKEEKKKRLYVFCFF